jgi:hypothetical protein
MRDIKRGFKPRITVCRVKTANLIAGERQILNRWAEYYEENFSSSVMQLLNAETVFIGPGLHISVPTVTEAYDAITRMKNDRAPGEEAITTELIKKAVDVFWKNIYQLIVSVWEKEVMQEEWKTAIICPILKKKAVS